MIAIIHGLDRALDQVMVVIIGVSRGPAGVPQLHLERGIDDCARRIQGEKESGHPEEYR
jgi:hypothetical protein